jgi:hypothetical protein
MPENDTKNQSQDNEQAQPQNQTNNKTTTSPTMAGTKSTKKAASKKAGKKMIKKTSKKGGKKAATKAGEVGRKSGWQTAKPYPTATFESVLPIAQTIFEHAGASREMRRATVFEILGRASESGPGRTLVTNSARYGLTIGSYKADVLKLTDAAITILTPSTPSAEVIRARFSLAIQGIASFNSLYEKFRGGRLPAVQVMIDALEGVDLNDRQECVEIFVGNLNYIGLLNVVEGAEWIINIDTSIDTVKTSEARKVAQVETDSVSARAETSAQTDFDSICFFMAPIGKEGDEKRKHSDMVLSTLVAPALSQSGLSVIRADQIEKPGMISKHIIEYIWKSRLAIVDLSFHNPNVFYELAIRHMLGKPTVHIVKKSDGIPFDIGNFRTIELEDMGYDFVARIETHKVTIANYVREALDGSSSADNPILTFFPELKVAL